MGYLRWIKKLLKKAKGYREVDDGEERTCANKEEAVKSENNVLKEFSTSVVNLNQTDINSKVFPCQKDKFEEQLHYVIRITIVFSMCEA
ncbi:hypothetical protein L596_013842 [Steinernema carpocapsae]|uniref:Uncharacterized protein n=1 Tax=Steinernema carpocapsae TaxID=34508 RepID=A0A4U5P2Q1_STECR|nr:hypothetical protein L596_013842 [Steinernema carpocapsae]